MNFISDAVEPVLDSVVNITVEVDHSSMFTKKNLVSTGSGFVIGSDGTILTNAHVVSDMCEGGKLTVTASDGVKFTGFIASIDPLSDLAIVKILPGENESDNANVHRVWPVVKFMSSKDSELRPGDWVVAIGSPFGLQNTVTAGIVSSRSRKNTEIGGSRDGRVEYIQTDCAVHSGSSGGPLINLNSEVVGINTSRAESEAISFAIRVDNAIGIIQQMAATGKVVRPWIGIKRQGEQRVIEALQTILTLKKNEGLRMVGLSANVWQQLRMQGPLDCFPPTEKGVLVTSVFPGSPAELAGLLQGDVITSVKTARVDNTQEVYSIVGHKIGHPVEFTIARRVPLDVDWDGRISNYEDQVKTLYIRPAELLEEQLLESPDFLA